MRISDWSSDVCSSDLDDLRALLQHHFRVLRKKPDQLLAVGFQHVGAHERALADKIRLRLADRPGEAGIIRCDRPVRRSEEHTSELQSLMRISYAVFCLKKKNKQSST